MGVTNLVAGDLHILGNCYGGSASSAIGVYATNTGNVWVKKAFGGTGSGAVGAGVPAGSTTKIYYEQSLLGDAPSYPNGAVNCLLLVNAPLSGVQVIDENNQRIILRPVSGVVPAQANVRSGTVYGDAAYTGSLSVPPPDRVSVGVPTDDTVGTGYITAADLAADPTIAGIASGVQTINDRIVYNVPAGPVVSIPAPSGPTKTIAWAYCYDVHGALAAGIEVVIRMRDAGGLKGAYSAQVVKALSGADGIATLEIPRNPKAHFDVRRGPAPGLGSPGWTPIRLSYRL